MGLPLDCFQAERSLPLNNWTASEGAVPACSGVLGIPGVTIAGMGRERSPVFHLITGTVAAKAVNATGSKYRIRIAPLILTSRRLRPGLRYASHQLGSQSATRNAQKRNDQEEEQKGHNHE